MVCSFHTDTSSLSLSEIQNDLGDIYILQLETIKQAIEGNGCENPNMR
jgi:hypothetical protein